uniref:Uncharacterized protein n=1 Tax=Varanus komodoensis TaxID=61221 RepID=A0A8D2L216_VARKO
RLGPGPLEGLSPSARAVRPNPPTQMLPSPQHLPSALFLQMSEKYGPVFMVYLGLDQAVILYGYDVVKTVLVDRGQEFLDRGSFPTSNKSNGELGIFMSNGERWAQLRRFSLTTLRNFGMGKKSLEERIQEEAQHLVEALRPCNPATLFSGATSNVISHILFGERFDYQDPELLRILHFLQEGFLAFSLSPPQLYNIFPRIMDYLPGPHQTFFRHLRGVLAFADRKVQEHESSLDLSAVPEDFTDAFLLKMEQEKHNPRTEFTRENLVMTVNDLFLAGTETTGITLRYILMVLLEHPAVEGLIHEEIDRVVGKVRPPAMKDRSQMPYTEAAIHEAQRFLDLIPLGFVRMARQDVQLAGFTIPKGATIYPILSSVLNDPKQYKNPSRFDPEHFLDENGDFKKSSADMPFSAGKRNCLGEGLARMELFLFLTTILQSFRLMHPPGVAQINLTPEVSGVGHIPRQASFCFCPR